MKTLRVIVADDHGLFRQGLRSILEGASDFKVVGEAGDGRDLLKLMKKVTTDMVLLDISMPNLRGLEAIAEIKRDHPGVKILVITMYDDKELLCQAMTAGADGYFLKSEMGNELLAAIGRVRNGKMYVSPPLSDELAADWERIRQGFQKPLLTDREKEILSLIGQGKSNKETADLLFVSVHTVERHRANLMKKLNLSGTANLVKYAIQKGYCDLPPQ